ncbi:hypothetical protein B879_03750 [Cecembia lonarensis LW9]|uniref:Uncharacterized protein n=1 Tax=Cecembia lonarensis (strain CCUG 58316 / KCTC 22772 / LW9) TaxID=1225176 RepID=K1LU56_CECL9|nr:hypothetical protein B879_03750 [Cecembia lonarensis LW9]
MAKFDSCLRYMKLVETNINDNYRQNSSFITKPISKIVFLRL